MREMSLARGIESKTNSYAILYSASMEPYMIYSHNFLKLSSSVGFFSKYLVSMRMLLRVRGSIRDLAVTTSRARANSHLHLSSHACLQRANFRSSMHGEIRELWKRDLITSINLCWLNTYPRHNVTHVKFQWVDPVRLILTLHLDSENTSWISITMKRWLVTVDLQSLISSSFCLRETFCPIYLLQISPLLSYSIALNKARTRLFTRGTYTNFSALVK